MIGIIGLINSVYSNKGETMQKNMMDFAKEFTEKGIDFIEKQAPQLCNEVIRWGIGQEVFWIVICILMSIACIVFLKKYSRVFAKETGDEFVQGMCYIIPMCLLVTNIIGLCCAIWQLVYICVAPRLYLLEVMTELLGNISGN